MGQDKPGYLLIVDDDEHILHSLKLYLSMEGYEVETADRGLRALELMEKSRPSAVLLDVMMPEMDGFEVLAKMRESDVMKSIPVIMVTAKSQDMDVLRGYQADVSSYITKPFNMDELVDTLRMILEKAE